jgi:DNA-binding response OmpR family regulator
MLAQDFEIVIMDIAKPGEDGADVARYLQAHSPLGIVVLTGRASRSERIKSLSETTDAWLSKPVDIEELAATLKSVSRRLRRNGESVSKNSHWSLHDKGWHLQSPDKRSISLNLPERLILMRLFEQAGEMVSRDQLIADVAEDVHDFDPHRLEMLIHRLRQKVSSQLGMTLPLRSVRGQGYVLLVSGERSAGG